MRDEVEFAAYLFYRFAADHPKLKGKDALDDWGEVRTPAAMVQEAERFHKQWVFRVFKVPEGAGLGVEIDPDQLARAAEVYRKCGMTERDDARTMKMIDPDYKTNVLY